METLRDLDIVRAAPASVRARRSDDQAMPTLEVRFSKFDTWYEIDSWWEGRFLERTKRGAFSKTIKERLSQIRCLYDHGYDFQIGNKVLGAIESLTEEPDSPVGVVPLFDTSYNRDLLPGLEAGVYGSSFRFRVIKEEWNDEPGRSDHNPDGLPERTITEVRLFEFGPVTWPANPDSTAGLRSLTDSYYERLRSRDPKRVDDLVARARQLRTPDDRPAVATLPGPGAAPHHTDEPAARHSGGLSPRERRLVLFPFLRST
ncbi:MAG TPA: HK97 family phage prohead protease [Micromonosporaceae bacterium]